MLLTMAVMLGYLYSEQSTGALFYRLVSLTLASVAYCLAKQHETWKLHLFTRCLMLCHFVNGIVTKCTLLLGM